MKTLLALLLLIPSLSWGDIFFMSCMPTKYQSSKNSEIIYYEPNPDYVENFFVDMKKKVIGRGIKTSLGFLDYEFTNEQDGFVCGGYDISYGVTQYICVNRLTLDLTISESDGKEWSNEFNYNCEQVERKF